MRYIHMTGIKDHCKNVINKAQMHESSQIDSLLYIFFFFKSVSCSAQTVSCRAAVYFAKDLAKKRKKKQHMKDCNEHQFHGITFFSFGLFEIRNSCTSISARLEHISYKTHFVIDTYNAQSFLQLQLLTLLQANSISQFSFPTFSFQSIDWFYVFQHFPSEAFYRY